MNTTQKLNIINNILKFNNLKVYEQEKYILEMLPLKEIKTIIKEAKNQNYIYCYYTQKLRKSKSPNAKFRLQILNLNKCLIQTPNKKYKINNLKQLLNSKAYNLEHKTFRQVKDYQISPQFAKIAHQKKYIINHLKKSSSGNWYYLIYNA